MGQADELPFGLHRVESPPRELAEAGGWFDRIAGLAFRRQGGSTGSFRFWSVSRPFLVRSVRAIRGCGVSDFGMRPRGTGGRSSGGFSRGVARCGTISCGTAHGGCDLFAADLASVVPRLLRDCDFPGVLSRAEAALSRGLK